MVNKKFWIGYSVGAILGVLVSGTCNTIQEYNGSLVDIIPIERDLNKDGIPDAIIRQHNCHETPMYGVKDTDSKTIHYVPKYEMLRRNPKDIIDYDKIEEMMNEE
ncbi:hypothetical protein KY332_01155 [Candidatus Woesearchaeota archaeon]|nr:hypothetical protein [Candidatus Woesearchaeota archaeon]